MRFFHVVLILWLGFLPAQILLADVEPLGREERRQKAKFLASESRSARERALQVARAQGWRIRSDGPGMAYQLVALRGLRPVYFLSFNANAAISTAVDLVRGSAPYSVNGAGVLAGVWDFGPALATHQEFGSRVTNLDSGPADDHATEVVGIIAAAGIDAAAEGMAPAAVIENYDFNDNTAEMLLRAAAGPGQTSQFLLSNHSYGVAGGWVLNTDFSGNVGPHWFGDISNREDMAFGLYDNLAQTWDTICYDARYFLPVKAAGNDRGDGVPGTGETFYYFSGGAWQSKTFDPGTDPFADSWDNGGYDTMLDAGNGKNVLTVGSVGDAVSGGVRSLANAAMSSFSNWGPTDDGRVKPDMVANGEALYSPTSGGNAAYSPITGTSAAAPNACGSLVLLQELYQNQFSGILPLASTLKALVLHTADDLGNPGPDYQFGWGLMNTKAAADQILAHAGMPLSHYISVCTIDGANPSYSFLVYSDGSEPLRATLCWTDPPAAISDTLDDPTPKLVHDLDLRIAGPAGASTTYPPFVLNPANPTANATTSDNTLDNVEQVSIATPAAGVYSVTVTHKGSLTEGSQRASLILSGQAPMPEIDVTGGPLEFGDQQVSGTSPAITVTIENRGDDDLLFSDISISGTDQTAFSFSPAPDTSVLAPGETREVSVVFEPASAGTKTAALNILCNDPDESTVSLPLSGNGVASAANTITLDTVSASLSESGGAYTLGVSLASPAASQITVDYVVNGGTADSGDFSLPATQSVTFNATEQSAAINITIVDDAVDETDETLEIQLTNPSGAVLGTSSSLTLTIQDDDASPGIVFSQVNYAGTEGDSFATVEIMLTGNQTEQTVSATVSTQNGSALQAEDYTAINQTVSFTPPNRLTEVHIALLDDSRVEGEEYFDVILSGPTGAALGTPNTARVSIEDDEPPLPEAGTAEWMLY